MSTKLDSKIGAIIGIGIFAGLASAFSFVEFQQVSSLEQEKSDLWTKVWYLNQDIEGWKTAHNYKELLIAGMIEEKNILYKENSGLQYKLNGMTNEYKKVQKEYNALAGKFGVVQSQKSQLEFEKQQTELQEFEKQQRFFQQVNEVVYYRQLSFYNYKSDEKWDFHWNIPFQYYFNYRNNAYGHYGAYADDAQTILYLHSALDTWKDLKYLADLLRKHSGSDDELFANLALQVTHQFFYQVTENTKYPIESFVEGSGDCDTLAVFAAALMKAGGLDTIVILGDAKGSPEDAKGIGHAMVGVNLSEEPNDHTRNSIGYITFEGKTYYVAEATWGSGVFTDPWNYDIVGSAVGDNPWSEFKYVPVIKTPS